MYSEKMLFGCIIIGIHITGNYKHTCETACSQSNETRICSHGIVIRFQERGVQSALHTEALKQSDPRGESRRVSGRTPQNAMASTH